MSDEPALAVVVHASWVEPELPPGVSDPREDDGDTLTTYADAVAAAMQDAVEESVGGVEEVDVSVTAGLAADEHQGGADE